MLLDDEALNPSEREPVPEQEPRPALTSDPEADVCRTILDALHAEVSSFDLFNPKQYLDLFYPEIDVGTTRRVPEIVDRIQTSEEGIRTISLTSFSEALVEGSSVETSPNVETLENFLIYDFMVRRAIPRILDVLPQDHLRVLDVGGGPSIYQHIPLLGIADQIYHTEFLARNRDVVQQWKQGASTHDWQSYFRAWQSSQKEASAIMGGDEDVQTRVAELVEMEPNALEDLLRQKIQSVTPVDVFQEGLGFSEQTSPDVVHVAREGNIELLTSNFCIESATADLGVWQKGIAHVANQVPSGKFLLMTSIRHSTWYQVGDKRMPAVSLDAKELALELASHGFDIVELTEMTGSEQEIVGYDGMIFILARKKES